VAGFGGREAVKALPCAVTAKVVVFCMFGPQVTVEASVVNKDGGTLLENVVDCVARAMTEASAMLCLSDHGSSREGSEWARE